MKYVKWFDELSKDDVSIAGGKGANLAEMANAGFPVPEGFVVVKDAYDQFLEENKLKEKIFEILKKTNVKDTAELTKTAEKIQNLILSASMPKDIEKEIREAYRKLCKVKKGIIIAGEEHEEFVAVRSSATAEDLPTASFAGQQKTLLNIKGEDEVVNAVKECWASLFTPRAIFYREEKGFKHEEVSIAVVVQRMINADKAGVMFTVNPATSDRSKIVIEGAYGLGEAVVSGQVTPDTYIVNKETLEIEEREISTQEWMLTRKGEKTVRVEVPEELRSKQKLEDSEIIELARYGKKIEEHYNFPQDIEWAIEGDKIYVLQSRPVTTLKEKAEEAEEEEEVEAKGEIILKGLAASPGIAVGKVKIIRDTSELDKVEKGDILVTKMTTPDMVPAMERAAAIVTDDGGLTCHAAIVSRELGIPCVVGTKKATQVLKEGEIITVDATRGIIYRGDVKVKESKKAEEVVTGAAPIITATAVKVNIDMPRLAEKAAATGAEGVGLLRAEHMILELGKHPRKFIEEGKEEELVEALANGIEKVCAAFYPYPVWYRTLDAPTGEFRRLEGGENEPEESNPMLGWRGIRRGLDEPWLLKAEFKAIKKVIERGYNNIGVMLPLVQHVDELRKAKKLAREVGLIPHKDCAFGIMVETPAAALCIEDFIKEGIDFISFGTNDLTQYTLAVDRDNARVAHLYNEAHPAVWKLIEYVIKKCKEAGVETSICGQAGSYPSFVEKLVELGIDSVSANIDAVQRIKRVVARVEQRIMLEAARELKKK